MIKSMLYFGFILIFLESCSKENDENQNFYNLEYRKGMWITDDKNDTLHFKDSNDLVRKGLHNTYEEYSYRINDQIMYLTLPGALTETVHPILNAENNTVRIGSMFTTFGLNDNSGLYYKNE